MKMIKRVGWGFRGRRRGKRKSEIELIRLEKHAGLNTLLMSTTKDSSRVPRGLVGTLCMIQRVEVFKCVMCVCVAMSACVWVHACGSQQGEVEVTLGLPCPRSVTVVTPLIAVEGR